MINYSELIQINTSFQTSIHLEYDLNDINKLESYVPTTQSVEILNQFLEPICHKSSANKRAKVLVGPYGKGKSHLLLVLTALSSLDIMDSSPKAKEVQTNLSDKIKKINPQVGQLTESLLQSNTRLLPVIIDSNTTDIAQALLRGLDEALNRVNIHNLLPSTHFDAAIDTINTWKSDYPEAYQTFTSLLQSQKKTVSDFLIDLKRYDSTTYEIFSDLYPQITAGSKFNPMGNQNIIKLYSAVLDSLCNSTPFTGIHIILDEFSKFLEANLDSSKMSNFKIIQDLAEKASRSKDQQLHFTCITHKNIQAYSTSPNFKAVEGRFLELLFISSSQENYELISNALEKNPNFEEFYQKHQTVFQTSQENTLPLFQDFSQEDFEVHVMKGCFPLSPLCTFSLIAISELVGQNERTLFTFLAQQDKYALCDFLQKPRTEVEFLTSDYLYNYFEILFQKEPSHSPIYMTWSKTRLALLQCETHDEKRLLQAMALIQMIGDPRLKTTKSHLKATLMMDEDQFQTTTKPLLQKHILSIRDNQEFVLLTANGIDIKKAVTDYVSSKIGKINVTNLLTEGFDRGIIIPREYNDQFTMFRYFKQIYMDFHLLSQYKSATQFLEDYPYDGVIIHLLAKTPPTQEDFKPIQELFQDHPQIIFCLSDSPFLLDHLLQEILAIHHLKNDKQGDSLYLEELEFYHHDILQQISHTLDAYFSPSSPHSRFLNGNTSLPVMKKSMLSQRVSEICQQHYPLTPVLNNEMVNKNLLNTQNIKARNLTLEWILKHHDQNIIPPMDGQGPEVSIFQSIFHRTNLDQDPIPSDQGLVEVFHEISSFISNATTEKQNFQTLYHTLTAPPYGIRKGILPLLLGYQLRNFQDGITIYFKNKELPLSASLLSNINENPEGYTLSIEENTLERQAYVEHLYTLFLPQETSKTSVYPLVKEMQGWLLSLPQYTKYYTKEPDSEALSPCYLALRQELLKFELNPRTLIYDTIPKLLSTQNDYPNTSQALTLWKHQLDSHLSRCQTHFIQITKELFSPHYQGSLTEAIKLWKPSVSPSITQRNSKELLDFAENLSTYNEIDVLSQLIQRFVNISLADWKDQSPDLYLSSLQQTLTHCQEHTPQNIAPTELNKKISPNTIAPPSTHTHQSIPTKITPIGQTLKNNLQDIIEEYQESITADELIAILSSLIDEL